MIPVVFPSNPCARNLKAGNRGRTLRTVRRALQGSVVGIENKAARLYGLQYHPEVQHSERGVFTLRRFLFDIAGIPADWRIENVLEEELEKIRTVVCAPFPLFCSLDHVSSVSKGYGTRGSVHMESVW